MWHVTTSRNKRKELWAKNFEFDLEPPIFDTNTFDWYYPTSLNDYLGIRGSNLIFSDISLIRDFVQELNKLEFGYRVWNFFYHRFFWS